MLVGIGLWIRLGILETPIFTRLLAERRTAAAPVAEVLRKNWREVILTCLLRTGQQAPFYIFWTYVLLYSVGRYWISFYRVDTIVALGLRQAQLVALVGILLGAIALAKLLVIDHRERRTPASVTSTKR